MFILWFQLYSYLWFCLYIHHSKIFLYLISQEIASKHQFNSFKMDVHHKIYFTYFQIWPRPSNCRVTSYLSQNIETSCAWYHKCAVPWKSQLEDQLQPTPKKKKIKQWKACDGGHNHDGFFLFGGGVFFLRRFTSGL